LAKGGKTVYFSDTDSRTLLDYFESRGARPCGNQENPAECILELVVRGANGNGQDWHSVWTPSKECGEVQAEIESIHAIAKPQTEGAAADDNHSEFAMPLLAQVRIFTEFQQYRRMPQYVLAKLILNVATGLFVGFTFWKPSGPQAGMRDIIFAVFMLTTPSMTSCSKSSHSSSRKDHCTRCASA
jgi:ATP-binding cassette subfamily G (WHITE) protein 2 (PDR)